jgi:WD40 repeat protein
VRHFDLSQYEYPLLPAFSPCGRWLHGNGIVLVVAWDLSASRAEPAWTDYEFRGMLSRHAVSPCGRYLAGAEDRCVLVWDLVNRGEAKWLCANPSGDHTLDVAFTPDGNDLLTACIDGRGGVQRWKTGSWRRKPAFALRARCDGPLAVSPDGRTVATVNRPGPNAPPGNRIALWRYPHGTHRRTGAHSAGSVSRIAFSPDGTLLATDDDWKRVRVWDARTLDPVAQFAPRPVKKAKRPSVPVNHFAFHPSGRYLAVAGTSGAVEFVDTTTWRSARCFDWKIGPVYGVAFARDGTLAAAGGAPGQVVVWDLDL